jgi:hypothetical protein
MKQKRRSFSAQFKFETVMDKVYPIVKTAR